jgi:hypothetical protein
MNAKNLDLMLVLRLLDQFTGRGVHPVDRLVDDGFPKEFVLPLSKIHRDERALRALKSADGQARQPLRGVSDLDLLQAIGRAVGMRPGSLPESTHPTTLAAAYRKQIRALIAKAGASAFGR